MRRKAEECCESGYQDNSGDSDSVTQGITNSTTILGMSSTPFRAQSTYMLSAPLIVAACFSSNSSSMTAIAVTTMPCLQTWCMSSVISQIISAVVNIVCGVSLANSRIGHRKIPSNMAITAITHLWVTGNFPHVENFCVNLLSAHIIVFRILCLIVSISFLFIFFLLLLSFF